MILRFWLLSLTLLVFLSACAVNPVTGEKELTLVSEAQELAIGQAEYAPARQAQGGDYVVDPVLTAYVNRVGQRLAAVSDRKLPYEFKVLNSSVPNAWAMPGGKITINRGLLTELKSEAELAAVLGHEIVHAAAKHGAQGITRGLLLQGAVVGVAIATQEQDYGEWAVAGSTIGAQLINQKYGRDDEREADHYGMLYMARAGYDPQGAVDLQRTFLALQDGKRQDWITGFFASHPPSQERLNNNIAMLATLPSGGEVGRESYQAEIGRLMETKPAYAAFDEGRKALTDKNPAEALRLAQQAIAIEPDEAIFYGLLGDVEQQQKRLDRAVVHYSQAIRLNPDYFYHYLQRGRVNEQLNRTDAAQADLAQSVELMPTADAYYLLGNIARDAGQLAAAKDYYAKTSTSSSAVGKQAYGALVDLDLASNSAAYIKLRDLQDENGRILAEIDNPTPRDIDRIQITVLYATEEGLQGSFDVRLDERVMAETKQRFELAITERLASEKAKSYSLKLVTARVAD
jgi:predicted Zn-dependent protease